MLCNARLQAMILPVFGLMHIETSKP
jgi:hypothetical protein